MNPNKHSERNTIKTISNLLSPYKASKSNTTLLLAAALEEYQEKISSLEKQLHMTMVENSALRKDIKLLQDMQNERIDSSIPNSGNHIHDDFSSEALHITPESQSQSSSFIKNEKDQENHIVRVRVSGDTSSMQRQVLTSLLDYINAEKSNKDFESIRIRAADALETLKGSIPLIDCSGEKKMRNFWEQKLNYDSEVEEKDITTYDMRYCNCTQVSNKFVATLKDHLGNILDLDSCILAEDDHVIFLKNDVLIHALTLLLDERDIFIDEITTIHHMNIET